MDFDADCDPLAVEETKPIHRESTDPESDVPKAATWVHEDLAQVRIFLCAPRSPVYV